MNLWQALQDALEPLQAIEDLIAAVAHPNPREALDSYFREFPKYFQAGVHPEPLTNLVRTAQAWGLPEWVGLAASVLMPLPGGKAIQVVRAGKTVEAVLDGRRLKVALEGLDVPLISTRGFTVHTGGQVIEIPRLPDVPVLDLVSAPPAWAVTGKRKLATETEVTFFRRGLGVRALLDDRYSKALVDDTGVWWAAGRDALVGPLTPLELPEAPIYGGVYATYLKAHERLAPGLAKFVEAFMDAPLPAAATELISAGSVWSRLLLDDPLGRQTAKVLDSLPLGVRLYAHHAGAVWQTGLGAGLFRRWAVTEGISGRNGDDLLELLAKAPPELRTALWALSKAAVQPTTPMEVVRYSNARFNLIEAAQATGRPLTLGTPASFSRSPDWEWPGSVKFVVRVNPDTPVVDIANVGGMSVFRRQAEVMLLPGTGIRVTEVQTDPQLGVHVVRGVALPPQVGWRGGILLGLGGLLHTTAYRGAENE